MDTHLAWTIIVLAMGGTLVQRAVAESASRPDAVAPQRPKIDSTEFGSITIAGKLYTHDVLMRLDGKIEKRKKSLSKKDGTSHVISLDEARYVYQDGASRLILGCGQDGMVTLSDEAAAFFKQKKCTVDILKTPAAVRAFNEAQGPVIGLFHVTC